jgi:hypothetical protein
MLTPEISPECPKILRKTFLLKSITKTRNTQRRVNTCQRRVITLSSFK